MLTPGPLVGYLQNTQGNVREVEALSAIVETVEETQDEEVQDDAIADTYVAPVRYDITSFGADYDVEGLVNRLVRGDILIPSFQRNYVWTLQEASGFIESLLLGLPVPGIFLAREPHSNKLLVIDGQQRLKSLQYFYEGRFHSGGNGATREFRLSKVDSRFEGTTIHTLEEPDRIRLNDSLIHATIVKQDSPKNDDTSIYYIFDRLNSRGRLLTPQEIRTAVYHGDLIDLIKDLNEYHNWRSLFGRRNARLKDQELVLRFLALYFDGDEYARPMKEFLNKFAAEHRVADPDFLDGSRSLFIRTTDMVWGHVGDRAFRLATTVNAAVYDSIMVGLARRIERGPITDPEKLSEAYHALLADSNYQRIVSQSTSDEKNVAERIRAATEQFDAV